MHKIKKHQVGGMLSAISPMIYNVGQEMAWKQAMPKINGIPGIEGLKMPDKLGTTVNAGNRSSSNFSQFAGKAGAIADMVGGAIPKTEQSALTTGLNSGYDAIANGVAAIPGVGTAISGIMKVGGLASDALTSLGVGTDQMTTADKFLDSKFLKLTPMGLINAFGAKKAATITKDNEAFEQVGSSYGGTSSQVDDALTKSGKKYGLMSRKGLNKANDEIYAANVQQKKVSNIADTARLNALASNNSLNGLATQFDLSGGYQQRGTQIGKQGMKVIDTTDAKRILAKKPKKNRSVRLEEVAGFKEGGTINVIPDGALHAHKHHLEDIDDKFGDVTSKGIPVITEEGGDIKQHAEVERNEIIFCIEVTEKLEKLMKDGSDEAAIEAGKLLVHEILENTEDNTGLLQEVE